MVAPLHSVGFLFFNPCLPPIENLFYIPSIGGELNLFASSLKIFICLTFHCPESYELSRYTKAAQVTKSEWDTGKMSALQKRQAVIYQPVFNTRHSLARSCITTNYKRQIHYTEIQRRHSNMLNLEDDLAIHRVLALHGHLSDTHNTKHFGRVFSQDIVYDLSAVGMGVLTGLDALSASKPTDNPNNPIAQHLTNVVLSAQSDDTVHALSKSIAVRPDGSCLSVTYFDVIVRLPVGWRVSKRTVYLPANAPIFGISSDIISN